MTICHKAIQVWRFGLRGGLRRRDFVVGHHLLWWSAAFGGNVGRVVEVKEEEQHGPGVVERDGVEQPRVIARGNEHVVAGMTHYCHKLRLTVT